MTYSYKEIIAQLTALGERQLKQETRAKEIIQQALDSNGTPYGEQIYEVEIPNYTDWGLVADSKEILAKPCGLRSGTIPKTNLISSLISSQKNPYDANINCNPLCPVISKSNHYHAPALAVSRDDFGTLAQAEQVEAYMNVDRTQHQSVNILVGNIINPKHLIVSHYDSIETGAVDNASGVAVSLDIIISHPELLETCCFAICGNEEISFDEPVYWGHGYRVFEAEYKELLKNTDNIIVADSFGYSDLEVIADKATLMLGFPIKDIDSYLHKTVMISGSYEELMCFYHAENDTPELITEQYYEQAKTYILDTIT